MRNPFFDFLKYQTKRSRKIQLCNYIVPYKELLSDPILDLGKCPSQKMYESESAHFLDWALPAVQT